MALSHSPKIVTDGLVLCLDAGNPKSFKGESTTNEIVSVTWWGDGSNQTGLVKSSVVVDEDYLKYKGYETYLWTPGTSLNCYLNGSDLSTGRTSTVWTFSCYVKREDGAPITSLSVYMYYPSSDGSSAGTIENVGDGWYRVSRTRTGTNNYLSLVGFTGFVSGKKYYLSGAQLEKKSYPTTPAATNTTRGTTVATNGGWKDLIGSNNGELVNGVSENSDNLGSLVFDGVNDYISIPSQLDAQSPLTGYGSFTGADTNAFTLEIWIKTSQISGSNSYTAPHLIGRDNGDIYSNLTLYNGYVYFVHYNSAWLDNLKSTTMVADNIWHQVVYVNNTNETGIIYIDGKNEVSGSSSISGANYFSPDYIGRGYSNRYFQGIISICKFYDRSLTASEIQQNFNALRGRFGI